MDTQFDRLTGLLNREALRAVGEELIAEARTSGGMLGFIHADIDGMKYTDDMYGFPAGDRLIVSIAQVIQARFPERAVAGRVGGDEFLIIMPTMNEGKTEALAEAMRAEAKTIIVMGGRDDEVPTEPVTLTLGLSSYPRHGEDLETLWIAAEEATHAGKHSGRDRVCWPDSG